MVRLGSAELGEVETIFTQIIMLESDPVVRMDLEDLAVSLLPGTSVTSGTNLGEVVSAILSAGPKTCVMVGRSSLTQSADIQKVLTVAAARQARVVVLGGTTVLPFPAVFVDLPFSSDMVLAALGGEGPEPAAGN